MVGNILELVTDDPEIIAAGYLHDIFESTGVTFGDIDADFGQRIADMVLQNTNPTPVEITIGGLMIKYADMLLNLSQGEKL